MGRRVEKLFLDVDMQYNMIHSFSISSESMVEKPLNFIGLVKEIYMEDVIVQHDLEGYKQERVSKMMPQCHNYEEDAMKDAHSGPSPA